MAEPAKLLALTPEQVLTFDNNFNQVQTRKLVLENISTGNVAFKVKTTALKAYLVRPSNAVLAPGEKKEVQIMLQKLTEKPKNHDHRFLVQALPTTDSELSSKDAWAELQRKATCQEFRLSVVFPESGSSYEGDATDLRSKYDELQAYTQKLENQKAVIESEMKKLEASAPSGAKRGYALWQLVAAVILALFVAKVAERYMQGKKFSRGLSFR